MKAMLRFVVIVTGVALKELAIAPFVRTPKFRDDTHYFRSQNIYLMTLLFIMELLLLPIAGAIGGFLDGLLKESPRALRDYAEFLAARGRGRATRNK